MKGKSKPSVNRKKEIMKSRNQQIFFFKREKKIEKLTKSKDGSLERPTKLIHQIEQEKEKAKEYKFSTSAMRKTLLIQLLQTLKDSYNIMNNFMPLNMKTQMKQKISLRNTFSKN